MRSTTEAQLLGTGLRVCVALLLLRAAQCAATLNYQFFAGLYNETGDTSVAWYTVTKLGSPFVAANVSAGSNVSWIAQHPSLDVAYAVQESSSGVVGAYAIDAATHSMSALGSVQSSGGNFPVHVSVHASGRFLFVANYGGNVAVLPLQPDGKLSPPVQTLNTGIFAHCVIVSPVSCNHVFVVSFGNDVVHQYVFDLHSARLLPNPFGASLILPPGTGPRHLLIHPFYPMAFIADEGNGTVALISVCAHDAVRGTLSFLGSWSAIPEGADAKGLFPSELLLSKDGRFLYVSVREKNQNLTRDSIAVFSVQPATSDVRLVANIPVCWCPRSITLMEGNAADIIVVGCQLDRRIETFLVDRESGLLQALGQAPAIDPVAFVGALAPQQSPSLAH